MAGARRAQATTQDAVARSTVSKRGGPEEVVPALNPFSRDGLVQLQGSLGNRRVAQLVGEAGRRRQAGGPPWASGGQADTAPDTARRVRAVQRRASIGGADDMPDGRRLLARELTQRSRVDVSLVRRSLAVTTGVPPRIQRVFSDGDRIQHPQYGTGTILSVEHGRYYVTWDKRVAWLPSPPSAFDIDDPSITLVGGTGPTQSPSLNANAPVPASTSTTTTAPPPTHDRFGNNIRRTQFESRLAAVLNNEPAVKVVVLRVTEAIHKCLTRLRFSAYKEILARLQQFHASQTSDRPSLLGYHRPIAEAHGGAMGSFMYSTTGTFGSISDDVPQMGAMSDVIEALEGGYGNIQSMLLAQQSFLFKIVFACQGDFVDYVGAALDDLKPKEAERGRTKDESARDQRQMHATLGITADYQADVTNATSVGAKNLRPHTRTQESTRPNEGHPATQEMRRLDMPFVGGLSGSAADLIVIARDVGGLTGDDLRCYTLGIIGYLVGGGMHSVHEIMVVAARAGLPYTAGDYNSIFPSTFRGTNAYVTLQQEFPDLIERPSTPWKKGGV